MLERFVESLWLKSLRSFPELLTNHRKAKAINDTSSNFELKTIYCEVFGCASYSRLLNWRCVSVGLADEVVQQFGSVDAIFVDIL